MQEVAIEQAKECYDFAEQNHKKDITPSEKDLKAFANKIGMDYDTAAGYVANFKDMLQMRLYETPMTVEATVYYLKRIYDRDSNEALALAGALSAVREHVVYQAMQGKVQKELLQEISKLIADLGVSADSTGISFFDDFQAFIAENSANPENVVYSVKADSTKHGITEELSQGKFTFRLQV